METGEQMKSFRLEFRADGIPFLTWHILAVNYLAACHNAQCKMHVYMANNCGNQISFEVFSE